VSPSRRSPRGKLASDAAAAPSPQSTGRYVVAEGRQVNYEGRLYAAGEMIEAPEPDAVQWLAAGIVTVKEAK